MKNLNLLSRLTDLKQWLIFFPDLVGYSQNTIISFGYVDILVKNIVLAGKKYFGITNWVFPDLGLAIHKTPS